MPSRVRNKFSEIVGSLDDLSLRLAVAARLWLLWLVVYAVSLGSTLWSFRHLTQVATLETNKLPLVESLWMLASVVGTLLALAIVSAGAILWVWRKTGKWRVVETAVALRRKLLLLAALPILPALTLNAVERDSPKQTFFYIAIFSAMFAAGAYAWIRPTGAEPLLFSIEAPESTPTPRRDRLSAALAGLAVAALWAGYALFFSRLSIVNHHALNSRTIDLGYYDNIFYQSIHGHPLACSLIKSGYHGSAHFDPLLIVLSPLYLLYPHAELLLVLQSVWLGAGVVPVYLIAKEKLGRRTSAVALSAMFALYPALHGANMYEFHSLSLLTSILLWLLYFFEKGRYRAYFIVFVIALLCREDAPLMLCFVGLYAIMARRPGSGRVGVTTIIVSLIYFVIIKRFFMASPDVFMSGKDAYSFAYYYDDLIPNKNGVAGIVLSIVTNPLFALKTMVAEPKLIYFITLFLPLFFLPFLAKTARVMLVYGLLFTLLATRTAVFSPAFQYSATLIPFAFTLTPIALQGIRDARLSLALGLDGPRLSRALLAGALCASVLVSWKFGGFLENQSFHGGFSRVARGLTPAEAETYSWVHGAVEQIPAGASVGVTNKLGCHVSNRRDVTFYPGTNDPDYVLLDESEIRGGDLDKHNKSVQQGKLILVTRRDKMALFRREGKKAAAASASASASAPVPAPPQLRLPPSATPPPG